MHKISKILSLFLVIGFILAGCVSVPAQSPELSAEIGKQIVESKSAHVALLGQYMNEKRDRIDEFIAREWIPAFATNVFKQPAVEKEWGRIVHSNNKPERLEFITGLGSMLQNKINAKRLELMAPIDELEQLLRVSLNEHYDQMIAANATLTTYLDSAVTVKERQHRVLKFMKVDGKLTQYMSKADEIVGKIVSGRDAFEKNRGKIQGIIDQVRNAVGGV
ncbi:hypothetical protein MMIC_P0312 [Mariprofundus micogutta]|uniref:Lipoprotein n=1 Tax=Mariprofundus micogutta TaxID=1921010 RepID=A0A1L8CKC8_9PROT|nr:hypothetical protein [Mariprofundus micogutta]GAV19378.1 hypothetical protein MMIC_P0312 [Mariprofundus micogutta]